MGKWRLLLTSLPFVVVAVTLKELARGPFGFPGLVELSELGVVFTGTFFLNGFMLAGTMADFKESEKLPGEVASTLESLEDTFAHHANVLPELDLAVLRATLLAAGEQLHRFVRKEATAEQAMEALDELRASFRAIERAGGKYYYIMRSLGDLATLRKSITRIDVISRTNFISTGYALLEAMAVVSMSLLLVAKFKSQVAEVVVVAVVTLIQVYMIRLIRDLDDPFEYGPAAVTGSTEVDLFPIEEYLARLRARIERPKTVAPRPLGDGRDEARREPVKVA